MIVVAVILLIGVLEEQRKANLQRHNGAVSANHSVSLSPRGIQYFREYPCTDDCSGHQAGYDWAERNGIDDNDDCDSNSQSFTEGCLVYVEENS